MARLSCTSYIRERGGKIQTVLVVEGNGEKLTTRPRRPAEPNLNVDVLLIHVVQIAQDQITLRLVEPDNPIRHGAVDPQRLPTRRGMDSDQRVRALNVLGSGGRVLAVQVRMCGPVDGVLTVDDCAEVRRQFLVRGVARCPERVATDGWDSVVMQVCDPRWLALVD